MRGIKLAVGALAIVSLGLTLGGGSVTAAPAPDEIDYDWVHREWERFLPPGTACAWPTQYVDERAGRGGDGTIEHPFATLSEAIAAADDPAVCGPTIILRPGRYELGHLVVGKPTIIRGQAGTSIVGSIINVSATPLWLEELVLADAPFPGAVFAAHPRAETTLVRVEIRNATGFGVLLHGGRLDLTDIGIERSRMAEKADIAQGVGWLAPILPRLTP